MNKIVKSDTVKPPFQTDIETIRARAREKIERGAVTAGYSGDRVLVIDLLNDALASELVCVLRYKRHYFMAAGIHSESVAAEFLEHAADEQRHADMIAKRIVQLQGAPQFSPEGMLTRSHTEYVESETLADMLKENLVAERIAIDTYRELVQYIGDRDPTTKRMLEAILADEETHADDLSSLLQNFGPEAGRSEKGTATQGKNEGEGNRTADREYRDGARAFVRSGQVDARAKEAAAAIDGPEGPKLRQAEDKARSAGKTEPR